jgi:anti-sigma regulatory factor (Ser/Thr protein kinase)
MRARLREWARAAGLDDRQIATIVLSVSEAAANSIEHGLRYDERGSVRVHACISHDGLLEATIGDTGSWRPETRSDAVRGFGMRIMGALMDDVGVEPRASGTVVRMALRPTVGHEEGRHVAAPLDLL